MASFLLMALVSKAPASFPLSAEVSTTVPAPRGPPVSLPLCSVSVPLAPLAKEFWEVDSTRLLPSVSPSSSVAPVPVR